MAWSTRRTSTASAVPLALAALLLAVPARAETLLHFTETATVSARPDELEATLNATAQAGTAAAAQAQVNRATEAALAEAARVPAVTASTGLYRVWHMPAQQGGKVPASWQASQSVQMHSHDGAALLALVGRLQAAGLAVDALDWRLSADATKRLHEEAQKQALQRLRTRAESAAGLLGLRFDSFREVRLDTAPPHGPVPFRAMAMAAAPAPMPPPVAQSDEVQVSASVEAEAVLQPPR